MKSYDFIIVGAGSAGCVLAAELSADQRYQVLLIESGPMDSSFLIHMPRGIGKILMPGNPHVWSYNITRGNNRGSELWLKGRAIGGSSSINGMVYSRGYPGDYDLWEQKYGCDGWGWADMLAHFKAHEDHFLGAADYRGAGGPLKVTGHPPREAGKATYDLGEAILNAFDKAGVPRVDDTNACPDGGSGYQPRNIYKGKRQSAAKVFLHPAMSRTNLDVMPDTQVLKVIFENKQAVGVIVRNKEGERTISCSREVILSAGAIESPKLLQLSGVGAAARLHALNIPVVHDSPQVGQNLREHYYLQLKYRVTKGSLNNQFSGLPLLKNVLRYMLFKTGPMANAAQELLAYFKSSPKMERPDCQVGIGLYSLKNTAKGPVLDSDPGINFCCYHVHPQSQGETYITSADPDAQPYIMANYLDRPEDKAASIAMVRFIRELAERPELKPFIVAEFEPGIDAQTDEEIIEAYHRFGGTAYHVSGTCRMGSDEQAVVDPRTRVKGVEGLRVVDTSIFPELITGNTNAPAMAAGRNAAKMILQDYAG